MQANMQTKHVGQNAQAKKHTRPEHQTNTQTKICRPKHTTQKLNFST